MDLIIKAISSKERARLKVLGSKLHGVPNLPEVYLIVLYSYQNKNNWI